jgi:hypothetical protein
MDQFELKRTLSASSRTKVPEKAVMSIGAVDEAAGQMMARTALQVAACCDVRFERIAFRQVC